MRNGEHILTAINADKK